jgi:AraC-like DNA-binding protein
VTDTAVGRPGPEVAPYVAEYVGYRFLGHEPGVHQGLPSRHLTVVVSLLDPVDMVRLPDPREGPVALGALAGGLHARPVEIRHDGNQFGIQLSVTPRGARALFGAPAAALASTVAPLDAVLPRTSELVDRLAAAPDWATRFAVLDEILGAAIRARPQPELRPEVAHAVARLTGAAGAVDIAALAREIGWSRRHLSARFGAELGIAPKTFARVLRFERSRHVLVHRATAPATAGRPSLAAVAAECNFADQAHMAREWSDIAGLSPSAWLAAEVFPFVQDEAQPVGAR